MVSEKGNMNTSYWLIGERHYSEFLDEIGINKSDIEKLVGKKVIGYANKESPEKLNGIKLKNKLK
jgi:hypothetical protein